MSRIPIYRVLWLVSVLVAALPHAVLAQTATDTVGALHARAVKTGGHLREQISFDAQDSAGTLRELIARSEFAIVGRVLTARCRPNKDRQKLETTAAVFVQDVIRGSLRTGELVYLQVPGGVHTFSDGVVVEQTIPDYRPLRSGRTYVLMLERKGHQMERGHALFTPAAGAQGQFELDFEHHTVEPAVLYPADSMRVRYTRMDIALFLQEAHAW